MGNLWIAQFDSSSSSSPSSTRSSSPGITKSTSNEGTHSGTGSAFSSSLDEISPNGQILPITPTLKIFSFAELKKATRNFRPDTVVGEGVFGTIFKGWIDENTFAPTKAGSGMAIAVKKLNSDDFQGRKEWQTEVNILGSLSHPNIVRLLGHCEKDKELLLVYEFMPRGSLANHLFSRGSPLLPWSIRLKIAIGVARGLAFLHSSERKIIHRNLTPCDILLDSNYNAKISNFGIARYGPPLGENSNVSTCAIGTYGYLAPEYVATGNAQNTSNEGMHSGTGSAFSSRLDEVFPDGQILPTPNLRTFTFAELKAATRNFRHDTVLGKGHFGTVFKGWIDEKTFAPTEAGSGMAIAVKKLNSDDFQGRKEWQSEVNNLRSLSHPNIMRLLGHCEKDKELLLVYEFMPSGSVGNRLSRRGSALLPWSILLKIAIGVARGFAFLHCSKRKIIHRDLKPYNVSIDSDDNAELSDFGIARNGPQQGENSHVSTDVMGTYGYVAPEYVATGHLYLKSDVYSFGVVLLEMLSGMRAFDTERPSGQQNLVDWAKPYLSDQRKVSRLMDRRLEGYYPYKGAAQIAQLILKCLIHCPRNRPSMAEVAEALEKMIMKKE